MLWVKGLWFLLINSEFHQKNTLQMLKPGEVENGKQHMLSGWPTQIKEVLPEPQKKMTQTPRKWCPKRYVLISLPIFQIFPAIFWYFHLQFRYSVTVPAILAQLLQAKTIISRDKNFRRSSLGAWDLNSPLGLMVPYLHAIKTEKDEPKLNPKQTTVGPRASRCIGIQMCYVVVWFADAKDLHGFWDHVNMFIMCRCQDKTENVKMSGF